jgi:hypothetical protein
MPVGRSDHKKRKEQRIDNMLGRAAKARNEGEAQHKKAETISSYIPLGQPILVGHHSEKRHRRDIKKITTAHRKSADAYEKADYYEGKAEAAAGNDAISGDDPEAVSRYKEKLAKLEALQEYMKTANAYWRKHKTMKGYPGLSDTGARKIDEQMKTEHYSGPFADFLLKNNNAEIRRIKEKLETLQKLDAMEDETTTFTGGKLLINTDINRVQFIFDDKPPEEIRSLLKHNGFRWAPSEGAWQRQRTPVAIRIAKGLISKLEGK